MVIDFSDKISRTEKALLAGVVMIEHPGSVFTVFSFFACDDLLPESLEDGLLIMLVHSCSIFQEFEANNPFNIEENDQQHFHFGFGMQALCGLGNDGDFH